MNGMKPEYLRGRKMSMEYYNPPNPYKKAPTCDIDLLELSRYASRAGKKLAELTSDEINWFRI